MVVVLVSNELHIGTWAVAPLAVLLRDYAKADTVRIERRIDHPVEYLHVEAIFSDGRVEEATVHEASEQTRLEREPWTEAQLDSIRRLRYDEDDE